MVPEDKYSTLVESARDGVTIVQDGIRKFCNQAMVDMLGYRYEELVDQPFVDIISPLHREKLQKLLHKVQAEKEPPRLHELQIVAKDGSQLDVEVSISPIQHEGHPACMAVIRDIGERKIVAEWNNPIYWIEELGQEANDFVGKKCANLGEMAKIGVPVPEGFALSLEASRIFLKESGIEEQMLQILQPIMAMEKIGQIYDTTNEHEVYKQVDKASKEIRGLIVNQRTPEPLRSQIIDYYKQLSEKCGIEDVPVAVRSSGALSMPGQMETYLNIRKEQPVLDHLKKVWASAFTRRALSWRMRHEDMKVSDANIGVAILRMVDAVCAGVGFTANPATGDDASVIIEGNWGFGESIVQGIVTPDTYKVDKKTLEVIDFSIGNKHQYCASMECGTDFIDVPEEDRCRACFSKEQAVELARTAIALEAHFEGPQDFEWAIDKHTQKVYMVQVRPAKHIPKAKGSTDKILDLMMSRFG